MTPVFILKEKLKAKPEFKNPLSLGEAFLSLVLPLFFGQLLIPN